MDALQDKITAEAVVDGAFAGARLDRAAELVWPDIGLRGRRRLIEAGALLVDGRPRPAAYRVRAGERLAAVALAAPEARFQPADVPVLGRCGAFAAVGKPAGLHSAAIAHGGGHSLDALLPALFPGETPVLLSRLDQLTSGIVPVAFDAAAVATYRRLEDAGQVVKTYHCVAHGVVTGPFVVDYRLDTADRSKTRMRFRTDPDPLRHTAVTPLGGAAGLTLLACRIHKGARHQIRAHLAAAGHPLVGDPLYGRGEGERLFLHCAALVSPVLTVEDAPPWSLELAREVVAAGHKP